MKNNKIYCDYGLLGGNLELRKNIIITFNQKGKIQDIQSEDSEEKLSFNSTKKLEIMLPGFINSHVHIADSFAKEFGYGRNLIDVVAPPKGLKHRLLNKIPKDIIINGIKTTISDMISNGITCFSDFREGGPLGINLLKNALIDEPIKCIIFGRFKTKFEISEVFDLADGIGLSSYSKLNKNEKMDLRKNKERFRKPIACHVAELRRNLSQFKDILNDKLIDIIVHGTKFQKYELEEIKKSGIKLVLCPRSNAYFGVGIPPIDYIFDLNIPISIGTDNIMANTPNLFEELRFIYYILNTFLKRKNRISFHPKNLLKSVTINAAKTFNLESDIGSISIGKSADFFKIDLSNPNFFVNKLDKYLIYAFLVQRINQSNIKSVYIGGKKVYGK